MIASVLTVAKGTPFGACVHAVATYLKSKRLKRITFSQRGILIDRVPRPFPEDAILLAYAGLVLEPDLDLLLARNAREVGSKPGREVFLNAWMTSPSCLGGAAWY